MVYQDLALCDSVDVAGNLFLGREITRHGLLDEDAMRVQARAMLDRLGIRIPRLSATVAGLSGGQARRLALARTLLADAPILLLDEPATGLDPATERAFFTTLNEVAEGRTVILIVHRLTGVERLDRIWRLSGGKAVAAAG